MSKRYTSRRDTATGMHDIIDTAEPEHRVCIAADSAHAGELVAFLNKQHVTAVMRAYESAVVLAAQERGLPCGDFGAAAIALPRDVFVALQKAFALQVEG